MDISKLPYRALEKMPEGWRRLVHEYGARAIEMHILYEMGELRGQTLETVKANLETRIGKPLVARKRRG